MVGLWDVDRDSELDRDPHREVFSNPDEPRHYVGVRLLATLVLAICAVAATFIFGVVAITKVTVLFRSMTPTVAFFVWGALAALLTWATWVSCRQAGQL